MFPCRELLISAVVVASALVAAAPARGDDVASFLERHGLIELLAVHWEVQLETATGAARDELVGRLASVYARLLETVSDPAKRIDLETRSRKLIQSAPGDETGPLRLALLRASYRSAETIAENHRLRLATEEELAQARQILTEIVPELGRLRKQFDGRMDVAQRRLSRAAGSEAIVQAEAAERAQQQHAQGTFLQAWALYYDAWLNDKPESARYAQRLFAELLEFDNEVPRPENVSVDLRAIEPIARCILGMGLCRSRTGSAAVGRAWLELLAHERTFPPMRAELPAWKIVVLLEHQEYAEVLGTLAARQASGDEIPVAWLRLGAVGGLEGIGTSKSANELARLCVTALAARGELSQVFDLASRYGTAALGAGGFAIRYVDGALSYFQAREAHGGDEPTGDAALRARYAEAEAALRAALDEPDAAQYADVRPDCMRLTGWCAWFQGNLRDARAAFGEAADLLPPDDAAEALWMAILCLDRLVETQTDVPDMERDLTLLIDRFLAEYPSSPHAPKLVLRRALARPTLTAEEIEELLAIPGNSGVRDPARRLAEQALYRAFRAARRAQRSANGARYLDVALPMQRRQEESLDLADRASIARFLTLSRRVLEVALHEGIERVTAATAVLASLERVGRESADVDLDALAGELAYRRLQLELARSDIDAATALADQLWEQRRDEVWARLASGAVFRHATRAWRGDPAGVDHEVLERVTRYGRRAIAGDDSRAALDRPDILARLSTVAEATMAIWRADRDEETGRRALVLYERLLEARPQNAGFLRATALLSETLGDPEQALRCWRRLVAGANPTEPMWFEAKFHLIDLLVERDPERARAVMSQHVELNPEYGPDPWGARLKGLHERLGAEAGAGGTSESDPS